MPVRPTADPRGHLLRRYLDDELGREGYPIPWYSPADDGGPTIKDYVRELAGHRCVRCGHPYRKGAHGSGEWSPCDEGWTPGGPVRVLWSGEWVETDLTGDGCVIEVGNDHGPVEARWRILTVHHLTGDKADCRWWNLAALCQRCHLSVQGRVNMAQVF